MGGVGCKVPPCPQSSSFFAHFTPSCAFSSASSGKMRSVPPLFSRVSDQLPGCGNLLLEHGVSLPAHGSVQHNRTAHESSLWDPRCCRSSRSTHSGRSVRPASISFFASASWPSCKSPTVYCSRSSCKPIMRFSQFPLLSSFQSAFASKNQPFLKSGLSCMT